MITTLSYKKKRERNNYNSQLENEGPLSLLADKGNKRYLENPYDARGMFFFF